MDRNSSTLILYSALAKWAIGMLFSVLLALLACPVAAQQGNIRISGKVTALEDGQPVAHASVRIDKKGVGTVSNSDGLFSIIIPAVNTADTLKISCIGFKTKLIPISSLKNGENLAVVLEKYTTELKEVKVVYYDALKIIAKAIERIPGNYISDQHILRGFYRVYAFADQYPLQLSEAVFDVFNFGYADKRADQFRLIKARNEKNSRDFSSLELGQKPNSIFADDIINHRSVSGFLSDDGLENHEFYVPGLVDFQGHEAYEIEFEEQPGVLDRTYRGRMFIDTKTFAFMYFDFGLSPASLNGSRSGSFIAQAAVARDKNVKFDLKEDHTEVSYQEVGHRWVLSHVTSSHLLSIKDPAASNLDAHVMFNYQVTAVDTAPKDSFDSKLGGGENINNRASDAGANFWKDYNIVLADQNTETIFEQIQDINKLKKKAK